MMRWVIGASMRARRAVVAVAAVLLVVGFIRLGDMPQDVLPEFVPPTVEVQTEALGLSAEEVEQLITVPLEQDLLNGIAFLEEIRSASVPGLSSIQMIFEPGTDLLDARQVVQERVSQAQVALPGVQSKPTQMLQPLSSTSRVMMVGLSSDQVSPIDLSILSRWTIGPKLLGVPGVANVAVFGFRDRQLQVLVDPQRLQERGISLQQIIETTANAQYVCPLTFVECSTPGTGGLIETTNQRIGVQHVPVTASAEDLARVPVEDTGSTGTTLGDVTEVVEDHQLLIGDAVGPDLLLVIEKFPAANTLDVARGVEDALDELRPGLSGIRIDTSLYRPASYLENSRGNQTLPLLIGALLVLLALGALLFDWRSTVVAVGTMLVAAATAALVLSLTNATLNAMVVAGLVLGLVVVVDDAVGDVDAYLRRLRERRAAGEGASATRTIIESALHMRSAAAYAVLIVLASVVAVFFTQGTFGAFFPSIASSFSIAVIMSMVVALIVTPALGIMLLGRVPDRGSPVIRWLQPRYHRALSRSLGSWRPAAIVLGALLVVGVAAIPLLSLSTAPAFNDTNILVHLEGASGTSLPEMQRVGDLMADELRAIPGVADAGAHVGRAVLSDQVVGTNAGQVWVSVDPEADYGTTVSAIEQAAGGYPGLRTKVTTYPGQRVEEVLSGPKAPVVVRLFGQDLDVLRDKGAEIERALSGIDGVVDPQLELPAEEPTLEIKVDLDAAARYEIRPGDVRRAAATLLSGIVVGSLFEEQKVFEVVVWGTPETRDDLSAVNDLSIDTPGGDRVRLGDVADVRIVPTPTVIRHEAVMRYVDVTAGVSGRSLGAVLTDVDRSLERIDVPLEYHAEVLRDFTAAQTADRRALGFAVAAAVVIFLLLQASFGSWLLAAATFGVLALSLTGGALAAIIAGGTLSLGGIAGLFGVFAIAARQVVLLIRHYRHLQEDEGASLDRDLVERGASDRLTPTLTSAVTIALLFVPLIVAGGIAGLEILHPMAIVVVGGLITSTMLALFVTPWLYLRLGTSGVGTSEVSVERLIDLTKHEDKELIGGGS